MVELHLVKEDLFPRPRMPGNGPALLPDSQAVVGGPLASHARLSARFLDSRAIFRVEEFSPTHVQAGGEVADVGDSLFFELLADGRVEFAVDFSAIEYRGFAALFRRLDAEK